MSAPPRLSVVLVTRGPLENLRLTIAALAAQTIARAIELLVVAPSADVLGDARPGELAAFLAVEAVGVGPIDDVDRASAAGLLRATAPLAASVEDHVFPTADWAGEIVRAGEEPWAVIGGRLLNANPGALSWANVLISDVSSASGPGGERRVPFSSHNVAYRTDVLREYGARLPSMMGRDGGLMSDLLRRGHRLGVNPRARYAHLQVTRWDVQPVLHLRSGRNAGANRARAGGWSLARKLAQVAALPLVPAVLVARRLREARRLGLPLAIVPPLVVGAGLFAIGEAAGHLWGAGRSRELLADFETERRHHLSRRDQARYDRALARLDADAGSPSGRPRSNGGAPTRRSGVDAP